MLIIYSYLVTNYEESNFSIYQATFQDGLKPDIVAIPSVDQKLASHMSRATKIGISLGSTIFFLSCILAIAFIFKIRRENRKRKAQPVSRDPSIRANISSVQEIAMNSLIGLYRELPEDGVAELHYSEPRCDPNNETSNSTTATAHQSDKILSPTTRETLDPRASNPSERFIVHNIRGESNYKISVSTNLSRQSWASADLALETPIVETAISTLNNVHINPALDRSLPTTPISESIQTSPITATFSKRVKRGMASDATTKRAAIVRSSHGTVENIPFPPSAISPTSRHPPLNAWQRALAHLSYSSMDMEIVIPPGASEVDIVNPLNIRKPTGRRNRRNFF